MTDEELEQLMRCLKYGSWAVQGFLEMKQFQSSMEKLQTQVGYSQEQLADVSQAILDMASKEITQDE